MKTHRRLIPFSPFPDLEIDFHWQWKNGTVLVDFEVNGAVGAIVVDPSSPTGRQDELWKNTCFEFFLKPRSGKSYYEANLSASGAWNLYRLDGYRQNLSEVAECTEPKVQYVSTSDKLHLHAEWDLKSIQKDLKASEKILLNPAVVTKMMNGEMSYWALKHSQAKPDFHHADQFQISFVAEEV